ncbi:MAG: rhodanese-like domain-containing protein [Pseudomonadota bacterium]
MKRLLNLCILSLALSQNWAVADEFNNDYRPEFSNTISAGDLKKSKGVLIVDVRLKEDLVSDPELIPGAMYGDPETLDQWSRNISKDRPIVVYWVAGKWVSQKAATLLSEKGFEVRSLDGGLNAWREQDN